MSTITETPSRMTKCSSHLSDLIAENSTCIGNHALRFTPKQLADRHPAGRPTNRSRQSRDIGDTMTEVPLSPIVSTVRSDGPLSTLTLRSDFQRRTMGANVDSGYLMGHLARCVRSRRLPYCQYVHHSPCEWIKPAASEL
jgi:hypothetical protein